MSDMVEHTKVSSSKWMKKEWDRCEDFSWQRGYGAFSLGYSSIEGVKEYIANQEDHHRGVTFQDEYRKLMMENGLVINEQFAWD